MLSKVYAAISAGLLGLYATSTLMGWAFTTYSRESQQESTARHQSGGHRSAWIHGYRGGK